MGGSSKKQTVGYKYFLGAHMGFCHGPIDKVTRIRVADRIAWEGESTGGQITVNSPSLFGGEEKEGGISGLVDFEFGEPAQDVNDYLQDKQNVSGETVPAYRGIAAAVLRQVYLGTNPYLKPWEFRAQRIHTSTRGAVQWYDAKSQIGGIDSIGAKTLTQTYFDGNSPDDISAYNTGAPAETGNPFLFDNAFNVIVTTSEGENVFYTYDLNNVSSEPLLVEAIVEWFDTPNVSSSRIISFGDPVAYFGPEFSWFGDEGRLRFDTNKTGFQWVSSNPVLGKTHIAIQIGSGTTRAYVGGVNVYEENTNNAQSNLTLQVGITNATFADYNYKIYEFAVRQEEKYTSNFDPPETIDQPDGIDPGDGADMNPAHIIRECLTDTSWGLGYIAADIDDTSFTAAADTLFEEEFGISLLWSQQTPIEDFILDILRHIDGTLYVNPRTGKFTLKLIRDDYTVGTLPILDESNIISISDYKKPTIGELTNYVTVKYWDRSTSEDSAISVQDIALAQQQSSVVSATIPMPGITRGELATRVASRELTALSNPLITCTIIGNREAASLNIGDAFKLSWPKFGLSETIMRVTNAQFGTLTDGRVKIECVQDVFGLPQATFSAPTDSNFVNPTNAPANSPFRLVQEANYWILIQDQGEDFTIDPLDGYLLTAATTPSSDALNYRIWTDESGSYEEKEAADFCPTATIAHDFPRATDGVINTVVGITGLATDDVDDIDIGSIAQIGNELLEVVAVSTTEATFGRAVADSAIEDHVTGDRIFFWGNSFYGAVGTLYQDNDTIGVKITPLTAQGSLDVSDATEQMLTFDQRAYRAWLPGNLTLNSVYFPYSVEGVETVDSAWSHRDRTLQTAGLNDFTESSIGPEVGTTYTTTLTRVNNSAQLDQNTGVTGTTDSLDPSGYDGLVRYSIVSVRDSLNSYYAHEHEFVVTRTSAVQEEQGAFMFTEDNEAIITES